MATRFRRAFNQRGDFAAMRAAEHWLSERGFSIGSNQSGAPRGVMFGDYRIAKWRNLDRVERHQLHGTLTGDGRNGPLVLEIFNNAPDEALAALTKPDRATHSAAGEFDARFPVIVLEDYGGDFARVCVIDPGSDVHGRDFLTPRDSLRPLRLGADRSAA